MTKPSVLITGANGLLGSKLTAQLRSKYHFQPLDISDPQQPVDITQLDQVQAVFAHSPAEVVIHLAAYTNVTAAWEQRGDRDGLAYQVNVVGTRNILTACQDHNKHLIHLSTAYVFNGEHDQPYTETDQPNPIEWYGQTKLEAERSIQKSAIDWAILRIDQPFRLDSFVKPDLIRKTIKLIQTNRPIFFDHYIGPTVIEELTKIIDWVIATRTTGLFHASSGEQWSDFELAKLINQQLLDGKYQVNPGKLDDYLATLNRPYQRNTALDTSRLQQLLPFKITSVKDSIKKVTQANNQQQTLT